MKRLLNLYSYALPPLLLPLGYWLWWRLCGDHRFVAIVLSMPILFAYIVPGLGTNWLGLWEFDTRWKLGRFRPHHGFVFGSATGILTLVCVDPRWPPFSGWELARTALVVGSFLAFWNWAYDILAIRAGLLVVYNRPYSRNQGPEAIATDYAPVFFGAFGACYGGAIRVCQYVLLEQGRWERVWWLAIACNLVVLVLPVVVFVVLYYLRTGSTGLRPCCRKGDSR